MKTTKSISSFLSKLPLVLLLAGIAIRIKVFVDNRSLFIDEANLARNVVEKSMFDFFVPLNYEQYAPPLLLVETKVLTWLVGVHDYTFRIIPLVAAIVSLVLVYLILERWKIALMSKIYVLGMLAFSVLGIRYGTEFKQYSSDALIGIGVVWMWSQDRGGPWGLAKMGFWCAAGVVGIWYSMPFVFVLGGLGLSFLYRADKRDRSRVVVVGLSWVLSFGVYYYMVLRHDIGDSNLENYHQTFFFDILASTREGWLNNIELITRLFKSVTDKTALSVLFSMGLFTVGIKHLYKRDKALLILLITPLILMVLASQLHLYSLIPRMTLFALPLMLMVIAQGLDKLWRGSSSSSSSSSFVKGLIIILVLVGIINKKGYEFLWKPMSYEEIKICLTFIERQKPAAHPLYVHADAVPAFDFYTRLASKPYTIPYAYISTWKEHPQQYASTQSQPTWILYSHTTNKVEQQQIETLKASYVVTQLLDGPYIGVYTLDNQYR